MFTDMVGYTALMQEDESRATTLRDRHRTVLRESIEAHQGEIVQFYGDGTLSVFPSAVQAVDAAVDIQRRFQLDPRIPVRIGLHIGDVIHDEDGVHGDGVNVASRVQELAVPGSVLISGGVYEELKNHPCLPTRALGDFELKNVQRPLSIHAVAASALAVPAPADLSSAGDRTKKAIAVLPFVNMSSDLENENFTDGITEEILNALVKFDDLNVTGRTSSFVFKGRHEDVREIGRALNVGTVLEGSVRKAGNRVRITAQLLDTADGYHLFSNTYDRVLEDIFAVQDEIAHTIARELRVLFPVAGAQTPTTVRKPTESSEAYSLYLRGLLLLEPIHAEHDSGGAPPFPRCPGAGPGLRPRPHRSRSLLRPPRVRPTPGRRGLPRRAGGGPARHRARSGDRHGSRVAGAGEALLRLGPGGGPELPGACHRAEPGIRGSPLLGRLLLYGLGALRRVSRNRRGRRVARPALVARPRRSGYCAPRCGKAP